MSKTPFFRLEHADVAINGSRILHDLNWRLDPGEHWLIRGPNGSGKSTLLNLIQGGVSPEVNRGRRVYTIEGRETSSPALVKESIALISPEQQERFLRLEWNRTGRDIVETGFHNTDYLYRPLTVREKKAVKSAGERLDLGELLARDIQTLSQGELRRLLVARALVGNPRLLLLDEFCDGLDSRTRERMVGWVDRIAREGTQVILTTHRPEEYFSALTHSLELRDGRIVGREKIDARFGVARVKQRGIGRAVSASRRPQPAAGRIRVEPPERGVYAAETSTGNHRHRHTEYFCTATPLRTEVRAPTEGLHPNAPPAAGKFESLFQLRSVTVYQGGKPVLRGVNWEMFRGENWAVLGKNGAGKSTFLRLVQGEVHPVEGGLINRFGETRRHTLWEIRQRVGYVSMDFQMRFEEELSGADAIATGFFGGHLIYDTLRRDQKKRVAELIELFDLRELAKRSVGSISYGQLRRILIARALVHAPAVLLLDEPFDGLEASVRELLRQHLNQLEALGTALVMVSHHANDLPACITHTMVMNSGRIEKVQPHRRPI